jgi:hypothetical protein
MEKLLKEVISKYERQILTINEVILKSDDKQLVLTTQACERFIKGFISDLRALEKLSNVPSNCNKPAVSKSESIEREAAVCNCIDYYKRSYYDKNNVKRCDTCHKPIQLQTDC